MFCNEGNNKSESIELADSLDKWLQLKNKVNVSLYIVYFNYLFCIFIILATVLNLIRINILKSYGWIVLYKKNKTITNCVKKFVSDHLISIYWFFIVYIYLFILYL